MLVSRPLKTIQPSGYQQNNRLQTCMFPHGFVFLHSKTLQTNDVQISIKKYVRHHYFGILRQCSLPKNSLYKLATLNDLNVFKPLNTNHDSGHAKICQVSAL